MCNALSYETLLNEIDIVLDCNIPAKLFTRDGKKYLGVSSGLGLVVELSGKYDSDNKLLKFKFDTIELYASCKYNYELIEMWLQTYLVDSSTSPVNDYSDVL